jgi:hypothetical protein
MCFLATTYGLCRFRTSIGAELSIKVRHASLWLCSAIVRNSQRAILAQIMALVSAHSTTNDMHHTETG